MSGDHYPPIGRLDDGQYDKFVQAETDIQDACEAFADVIFRLHPSVDRRVVWIEVRRAKSELFDRVRLREVIAKLDERLNFVEQVIVAGDA